LDKEGQVWLAVCVVSLSSKKKIGNVEMRKIGQISYWEYSFEEKRWETNSCLLLNDKEKQIQFLSARGFTMNEIADKMCMSVDAIKFYKKNLFGKFEVKNITEALIYAQNHKLL
jgi:DNA-binding CsgD family transcriptional regulator